MMFMVGIWSLCRRDCVKVDFARVQGYRDFTDLLLIPRLI
jgi:hypothetical protein